MYKRTFAQLLQIPTHQPILIVNPDLIAPVKTFLDFLCKDISSDLVGRQRRIGKQLLAVSQPHCQPPVAGPVPIRRIPRKSVAFPTSVGQMSRQLDKATLLD